MPPNTSSTPLSPMALPHIGTTSPTFAIVAFLRPQASNPTPRPTTRHVATWRIPPRSWFLPGDLGKETSAGTAPVLTTVCFGCPTFFQLGAMSHVGKEGRQGKGV